MHDLRSPISTELGLLFEQEREYVEDKAYLGLSSCGLMSDRCPFRSISPSHDPCSVEEGLHPGNHQHRQLGQGLRMPP